MTTVIEARRLSKQFILRHNQAGALKVRFMSWFDSSKRESAEAFWALRDVSMRIDAGESLGLVGRNGSGKSTFLKLVASIHRPTAGRLLITRGARVASLIELGIGFHPELTGEENVFLNAAIHGFSRAEIEAVYPAIVASSGLRQFMDVPLKTYSSGMTMRLGFAVAANMQPDVLLLDEIFAVGDADFQRRCVETIKAFQAKGTTVLFVSHSPAAIEDLCQRVCVLDAGRLLFDGGVDEGLARYRALTADAAGAEVSIGSTAHDAPSDADLNTAWHRTELGARWQETGDWEFDFLRRQGLAPHEFLLDMGCGSLAAAVHLLPYLEPRRYWGFEINRALFEAGVLVELARAGVRDDRGHFICNASFDLGECPIVFDTAIANAFFRRLPLNRIARCLVSVLQKLKPGGCFYATWLDNPDPLNLEPIERPDGTISYADARPYHYPFALLAQVCESVGAQAERLDEAGHPRGESVMVITRRP